MDKPVTILALCAGQPRPLPGGKPSAIDKRAIEGSVRIGKLGLEGDTQVDRKHHGGEHMAVHHYAADHYPYWREQIPEVARLAEPGAFGENLHGLGLTENAVYIGDRFRLGTALLEVSMGRQPCNTLQRHFARKDMVTRIISNHRCGWYYRVIMEGEAQAGDALELVERPQERWSIEAVFTRLFDPAEAARAREISDILSLAALAPQWRTKLETRLR